MKNIIMLMLGLVVTLGAWAGVPKLAGGGRVGGGPSKVVVVHPSFYYRNSFGYNPFYSPYMVYNPFYSPFGYPQQTSKLDLDIQQINNDYHHDIADARHDKSLSDSERKAKIRDLRHERANAVIDAKKGYYQNEEKNDDQIL